MERPPAWKMPRLGRLGNRLVVDPEQEPRMQGRHRRPARLAIMMGAALLAAPAAEAQVDMDRRAGPERQTVVQLAYTLGEAHALHRLCAGPTDATWYARMQRLEAEEGGDDAGRRQLVEAFNAGFAASQSRMVACSRRSRAAEQAVAARGAALARRLSAPEASQP
jgi:uncharacterized protein (TIGR02301 family)